MGSIPVIIEMANDKFCEGMYLNKRYFYLRRELKYFWLEKGMSSKLKHSF
ncbi:hypothetical protein KIS4809_3548 [Bacillus sp. ZZV12-4809]|nr:hypothetical protein KIS4809_3548 [Bacillus sp. ZZV12-4809]